MKNTHCCTIIALTNASPIIPYFYGENVYYTLPEEYYFSKDHEWVHVNENIATIGITEFAVESLGEVVYVELPNKGQTLTQFQSFGVVESVKAVSDLYSPISGRIIEINHALSDDTTGINKKPLTDGWLIKVEMINTSDLAALMRDKGYRLFVEQNK